MANHSANHPTLRSLSRRQWIQLTAIILSVVLVISGLLFARNFYAASSVQSQTVHTIDETQAASRGNARNALGGDTTYVNVVINGKSRRILGQGFTDVKSVLDAGDIILEPEDSITPSLKTKVSEATTITINRAGAHMETSESKIPFNVIKKETSSLPKGQEKVETEGQEGVVEKTNLVTRSGDKVVSSNTFASYVKKTPVDKVILVGTGSTSTNSGNNNQGNNTAQKPSNNIGTTVPVGEMQQWAHDYLLSHGYSEADFTATVYIITHESGWQVNATNPSSGAYGLPQALPGSKMVSAGADWATNYQTQLKWFWDYCNSRYGSIQGAYSYWLANKCY